MSSLHPATKGFGLAADVYERGRPDYPAAAVRRLVERLDLGPGRAVLDLAAGTGKLSRLLVPSGAEVIAVEPIDEMRALIAGVRAIAGTAEAIPLEDESVDAVTVAQAFHWFEADEALHEIRRVLRPRGGLALIWNTRDERDPVQRGISEILGPLGGETPRRHQRDWRAVLDETGLFTKCETALFKHRQKLDEDGLVERVMSISFVASATPSVRADVEDRVRELAREHDGRVRLPYVTELYVAYRAN